MKKGIKIVSLIIIAIVLIAGIGMKISAIYPIGFNMHDTTFQNDGVAIDGYDAVAYFDQNEAKKGKEEYKMTWNEATWYFPSSENLELFKNNPKYYAPAYGGHCSFAAGKGFAVQSDPKIWSINNTQLLLYSNEEVKTEGLENIDELIANANKNWK